MAEATPLLWSIQSAKVEARDAKILTGAPDHRGTVEVRQQDTVKCDGLITCST